MTSSYGYQRPLSNEEELYLQNQALRAELQRREGEKEGGFIEAIFWEKPHSQQVQCSWRSPCRSSFSPGRTTSATVDLSKLVKRLQMSVVQLQHVLHPKK
jgi:hypothetical protein